MKDKIAENSIKNKLKKIKEAKIRVNIYNTENYIQYEILIDQIIEPAMRPRNTSKFSGFYDPLSGYKKILLKKIMDNIDVKYIKLENTYLDIDIISNINPSKNSTKKTLFNILTGIDKIPTKKPDVDNIAKTLLDTLNENLYKDDSQVYSLKTSKFYTLEPENTKILITVYNKPEFKGRLEIEKYNSLNNKEKEIIDNWKEIKQNDK